ncbi:hypothetical protein TSUD_03800 [Trifolium subterraneum]|nr:hypothetical protein TSUD_03800 [Trifolium subterraneum]
MDCLTVIRGNHTFDAIVKYFLDNKTFQKVKFVYPKNKDSVELMRSYFDEENLPSELGGKNFWGSDDNLSNHRHCSAEVAPELNLVLT